MNRDCAECGAFGTGLLAANCSAACADVNVTLALAPILDDGWCKEKTLDNQLFFFLVENGAGGVMLRVRPQERKWEEMPYTLIFPSLLSLTAVPRAAWVSCVSALKLNCPPQIWNLGAGLPMGQGPYAVGRDAANVDVAAAVDRAPGICASVMMPAASGMRASSVEVPGAFGGMAGSEGFFLEEDRL